MSSEKKTAFAPTLFDLLKIDPSSRTQEEIEAILQATSSFVLFRELLEKDEYSRVPYECCKSITSKVYNENDYVCKRGDPADAFYWILKGSVRVLGKAEIELDKPEESQFQRRLTQKLEEKKIFEHSNTLEISVDQTDLEVESEVGILTVGNSFGEMALLNDRPRYFSIQCREPTILAVLQKSDYHIIQRIQDKQLNEKTAFLKSLDAFSNWTTVAAQKLTYFFKTINVKKGNFVYKEGDPATDIFIIKDGEFMLTQTYSINAGLKSAIQAFGQLKRTRNESIIRKKQLNVVIKQKGEFFGYNEIYENKSQREFTCVCHSTTGEVLVISDKNFAKKIVQPETLKCIEKECDYFKQWTRSRLASLRETEKFKDHTSFTPFSKLMLGTERGKSVEQEIKLPMLFVPVSVKPTLPLILDKLVKSSRNKSYTAERYSRNPMRSDVFQTEIEADYPSFHRKNETKRFNTSFAEYSLSPTKLLPSSMKKKLKKH